MAPGAPWSARRCARWCARGRPRRRDRVAGARVGRRRRPRSRPRPRLRGGGRAVLRRRWWQSRPRHRRHARIVGHRPTQCRRGARRYRRAPGRRMRRGVRRRAPARTPRDPRPGDGVLPVQQRGGRRGQARCRRREGGHRRLGRAPRQRHPGHLLRRPERAVRLDARVTAVSRHRSAARDRERPRLRGQPEPAVSGGYRRRHACGRRSTRWSCPGSNSSRPTG